MVRKPSPAPHWTLAAIFLPAIPSLRQTPILIDMVRELPLVGGTAIQAEDEIAAIGMCIGAALGGKRVLTATSGTWNGACTAKTSAWRLWVKSPMVPSSTVSAWGPRNRSRYDDFTGGYSNSSAGGLQGAIPSSFWLQPAWKIAIPAQCVLFCSPSVIVSPLLWPRIKKPFLCLRGRSMLNI